MPHKFKTYPISLIGALHISRNQNKLNWEDGDNGSSPKFENFISLFLLPARGTRAPLNSNMQKNNSSPSENFGLELFFCIFLWFRSLDKYATSMNVSSCICLDSSGTSFVVILVVNILLINCTELLIDQRIQFVSFIDFR